MPGDVSPAEAKAHHAGCDTYQEGMFACASFDWMVENPGDTAGSGEAAQGGGGGSDDDDDNGGSDDDDDNGGSDDDDDGSDDDDDGCDECPHRRHEDVCSGGDAFSAGEEDVALLHQLMAARPAWGATAPLSAAAASIVPSPPAPAPPLALAQPAQQGHLSPPGLSTRLRASLASWLLDVGKQQHQRFSSWLTWICRPRVVSFERSLQSIRSIGTSYQVPSSPPGPPNEPASTSSTLPTATSTSSATRWRPPPRSDEAISRLAKNVSKLGNVGEGAALDALRECNFNLSDAIQRCRKGPARSKP